MRAVTRARAALSSARNWVTRPRAPPASAGNLQAAGRVAGDLRSDGWRVVILLLMQRVCSKTIGFSGSRNEAYVPISFSIATSSRGAAGWLKKIALERDSRAPPLFP